MGSAKQNSKTHESENLPKEKYKDIEEAIQKAIDTEALQNSYKNKAHIKSVAEK